MQIYNDYNVVDTSLLSYQCKFIYENCREHVRKESEKKCKIFTNNAICNIRISNAHNITYI